MSPLSMNATQSRRVALGLLAAVVLLAIAAVAVPTWLLHRHYDRAVAESSERYDRLRRIASTRTDLARQLEAMRAKEPRRFFLRTGASAFSAAEMQEAMRTVIEQNGGRLITMQAPAVRDDARYRQITVNVQLTANVMALRRILNAIETQTPYLFVDSLMVRSQVQAAYKPGPGQEPEVFTTLDVTGYALVEP